MSKCNWSFNFEKDEMDWDQKQPNNSIQKFMRKCEACPLNMNFQLLECSMISDKLKENEELGRKLLDGKEQSHYDLEYKQKLKNAINVFGSLPVQSDQTRLLLEKLERFGSSKKIEEEAWVRLQEFTEGKGLLSIKEAENMVSLLDKRTGGDSKKKELLKKLGSEMKEIRSILEKMKNELSIFNGSTFMYIQNICSKKAKSRNLKNMFQIT